MLFLFPYKNVDFSASATDTHALSECISFCDLFLVSKLNIEFSWFTTVIDSLNQSCMEDMQTMLALWA